MAAVTTAVAVGVAAGATVYQADQARKQRKEAESVANEQRAQAKKARKKADAQQKEIEAQEDTANKRAEAIKKRRAAVGAQLSQRAEATGKGGTLLTGAPGADSSVGNLLGESSQEGIKTLLGV